MIPVYRRGHSFLHALHPAAQAALCACLVIPALAVDSPIVLAGILASTALLAAAAGVLREWGGWWKICAVVGAAAIAINPLVSREGSTVLWRGPRIPGFGRLTVSAEAIAYGAGMALRLATVIWAFALLTLIMDPDRALGLMRGRGSRSALVTALALRMVPTASRDAAEILDAQRARGLARDSGGRTAVLKSRIPLVRKLFMTSLDRAIGLAEAMESRAYGTGPRTRLHLYRYGPGELVTVILSLSTAALCLAGSITGKTSFRYYPKIVVNASLWNVLFAAVPLVLSAVLLISSWWWKRWAWSRSGT